jgi:hypothetical protein
VLYIQEKGINFHLVMEKCTLPRQSCLASIYPPYFSETYINNFEERLVGDILFTVPLKTLKYIPYQSYPLRKNAQTKSYSG